MQGRYGHYQQYIVNDTVLMMITSWIVSARFFIQLSSKILSYDTMGYMACLKYGSEASYQIVGSELKIS